ncbi:legionaminic acid biosynthesis protein PtmG [Gammaproteobacteria bacterium 45_16_T64]|nr:legionaminic acid biosynthesis protein PtmG [Gammaproteobacteria bacterium 45_16_T64]
MSSSVFWCSSCLNMSTRPRIAFDSKGRCNACVWMDEKKTLDWGGRQKELDRLLDKYRSKNSEGFDCVVPVSGGKDGSYVAYKLKHEYGMNPLTVTVRPALSLELGEQNLTSFIESGYNHIHVSPNSKVMQKLNKHGFIEKGFPYYGWLIAIKSAVIQTAMNFNIPLIFYGEDGEVEYGGSTESKHKALYNIEYMKRIYFEGGYDKVFGIVASEDGMTAGDLAFWRFPSEAQVKENELAFTHWSYYESWDSYRNYVVAKEHCGLMEKEEGTAGTFTNFSQNDQALYSLHAYLMYLKFGFGRATQDAGIEIRRGAMTREQALNLVMAYDNQYPYDFIDLYLEYYQMTKEEFDLVLDKYANRALFEKVDGVWEPKFTVGEAFEL